MNKRIVQKKELCEKVIAFAPALLRGEKTSSDFSIQELEGGIGPGAWILKFKEYGDFPVLVKTAGWINSETDHEVIRMQMDRVMEQNRESDLFAEIYGYFQASENRYLLISEYLVPENIREPHVREDDFTSILSVGKRAYSLSRLWKRQNEYLCAEDIQGTGLEEVLGYGTERLGGALAKKLLGKEHAGVMCLVRSALENFRSIEFQAYYRQSMSFIHRDIHLNNMIRTASGVRLIDFEIAGMDHPLLEMTRPLINFISPDVFPDLLKKAEEEYAGVLSLEDQEHFHSILLMDILICTGYELGYILTKPGPKKEQLALGLIHQRMEYLKWLAKVPGNFAAEKVDACYF